MNLQCEKIILIKKGLQGECSVKYNLLSINKIQIDLTSGTAPVQMHKFDGNPVISGPLWEDLKEEILEHFQDDLAEAKDGIYEFSLDWTYTVKSLT